VIVVGITGSLASGKTQVTDLFKKYGARTFDADASARKAVKKGSPVYGAIVKLFGRKYLKPDGSLDRAKLAERAFSHPKDLRKLNILIHPRVILDGLEVIDEVRGKEGILALDVPLLFESKMNNLADFTVLVRSRRETTLARAHKRGMPKKLARKILVAQWSPERKAKLVDFVIHNDGDVHALDKQVSGLIKEIQSRALPTGRQAAALR